MLVKQFSNSNHAKVGAFIDSGMQIAYLPSMEASLLKKTHSISSRNLRFIQSQIESGEYASASEVVRAGINALEQQKEAFDADFIEQTRRTVEKVRSGEMATVPAHEAFASVRDKLLRRAHEEGLS